MYLHEIPFRKAQEKLYMLGSRDHRSSDDAASEFAGAISGQIDSYKAKKAQDALKAKADKAAEEEQFNSDRLQERSDVEFIRGRSDASPVQSPEYQVEQGNALPILNAFPGRQDSVMTAKEALAKQKLNDLAEQTRMGGRYTPQGLEMTSVNAPKNAQDRLYLRSLIGANIAPSGLPNKGIGGSVYEWPITSRA